MTTGELEHWLGRYGSAWVERDPAAAAALFAKDARYFETPFDPPFTGRQAIREYWEDVPRSQTNITFDSRPLAITGSTAIAAWKATFTRVPSGARVELDGVFVLSFDGGGTCTELREWWHRRETP